MITLDMLGKLENFEGTFPVEYYYKNINEYLNWFGKSLLEGDPYVIEIYSYILKGEYPRYFQRIKDIIAKLEKEQPKLQKTKIWST